MSGVRAQAACVRAAPLAARRCSCCALTRELALQPEGARGAALAGRACVFCIIMTYGSFLYVSATQKVDARRANLFTCVAPMLSLVPHTSGRSGWQTHLSKQGSLLARIFPLHCQHVCQ